MTRADACSVLSIALLVGCAGSAASSARSTRRAAPPADPVAALMRVLEHGGVFYWLGRDQACVPYTVRGREPGTGVSLGSRPVVERDPGCTETWEMPVVIHLGLPHLGGTPSPPGFILLDGGKPRLVRAVGRDCSPDNGGWGTIGCAPRYRLSAGPGGAVRAGHGNLLFLDASACAATKARGAAIALLADDPCSQ